MVPGISLHDSYSRTPIGSTLGDVITAGVLLGW